MTKTTKLSRRAVLTGAGLAATTAACNYGTQFALLASPPQTDIVQPEWKESRVRRYRPLGATGFEMSDISFGCAGLSDPAVARRAIDRGVNYFDTAPDYSHASSERALGEALRGVPRDQVFVASKFCTPDGHLSHDAPPRTVIAAVEDSLKRLSTDHIDAVLIHACNSTDRLMAPSFHEAFDRLKDAGKVRFLGVSSHTPRLETVMRHAVHSGRFDMIMCAYNFESWPAQAEIFAQARERGVGVVAMKTLIGAYNSKLSDFTATERQSFPQAAFGWVLSNPDVSGLVVSIERFGQIDEYLHASGVTTVTPSEHALLDRYTQLVHHDYCRPGCGDCLEHCPSDVPIDDVLRYRMYARNYGRERQAMQQYARLDVDASACTHCPAPCESACSFGIPIRNQLRASHGLLRFA